MILDAYYKNLATQMCGNPNLLTFKNYGGTTKTYAKPTNTNYIRIVATSGILLDDLRTVNTKIGSVGVVLGDGTAEVSKDDYKLSGNVISTISASATEQSTYDDGQAVKSMVYTITNTGTTPITISEIGYYGNVGDTSSYSPALLERTLLETPLTIPAGGVGQIIYTIRMNNPTA